MPTDPETIKPPFSSEDEEAIRQALEEAQIDPEEHFEIPPEHPDPDHAGEYNDPNVPKPRVMENYNGQNPNGRWNIDQNFGWQPGCEQPFSIVISDAWSPPPADLAAVFDQWAAFATLRAIIICRRNIKCRRVQPLGCDAAWDVRQPNGERVAKASFVFQCVEI